MPGAWRCNHCNLRAFARKNAASHFLKTRCTLPPSIPLSFCFRLPNPLNVLPKNQEQPAHPIITMIPPILTGSLIPGTGSVTCRARPTKARQKSTAKRPGPNTGETYPRPDRWCWWCWWRYLVAWLMVDDIRLMMQLWTYNKFLKLSAIHICIVPIHSIFHNTASSPNVKNGFQHSTTPWPTIWVSFP